MGRANVWFELGQSEGHVAGSQHAMSHPFRSRQESWRVAICNSRPTVRRWQHFHDGWAMGFAQSNSGERTSSTLGNGHTARHVCEVVTSGEPPCTRTAVLLVPSNGVAACVRHAWSTLLEDEQLSTAIATTMQQQAASNGHWPPLQPKPDVRASYRARISPSFFTGHT
jgi:hypothetical protein